ncbi:MAG TPA: aminopeptidase [Opitutaceae bacterium]|nr:aminopeptidase [Opitutaceae bacterium]
MATAIDPRLRAFAEVIVRIGLNLRRGQRLVIAEPYELHGVDPAAAPLVDAVEAAARDAGTAGVEVLWGDPAALRRWAENNDERAFVTHVAAHASRMRSALQSRDALLFLQSGPARTLAAPGATRAGWPALAWERFGPLVQEFMAGATNWTAAPAPTPDWADTVYPERPAPERPGAMWDDVLGSLRLPVDGPAVPGPAPEKAIAAAALTDWTAHLSSLLLAAAELNRRCVRRVRFRGEGTDLEVALPAAHRWCSAQLRTRDGHPFVANLPTEEIFTAPDQRSARGRIRVAHPIVHGGVVIEGLELAFEDGEVVAATARRGAAAFEAFLATDDGARRLGEIAWLPAPSRVARGRRFGLPLLDENAAPHVALGESYAFTSSRSGDPRLNRSRVHLDLPLDAEVTFID